MSTDYKFINKVLADINRYKTNFSNEEFSNVSHPIDDEIISKLNELKDYINNDDDFSIFSQLDMIKDLWKQLISKSIICLRFYDGREPFKEKKGNANKKKPYAYGVDKLSEYFYQYSDFEALLYGGDKYYRDHVVHVFRVWLIGMVLLFKEKGEYLQNIKMCKDFDVNSLEKVSMWTIISLTHDLGYPLEKSINIIDKTRDMMKSFIYNPVVNMDISFSGVQNSMNDFVLRLMSSKMLKRIKTIDSNADDTEKKGKDEKKDTGERYVARLQPKYYFKLQKSLEHNKHGVISTLIIYKLLLFFLESDYSINEDYEFKIEDARQFYIRQTILRSIASHTCQDIYQLDILSFPFLLIICDDSQEWGRKYISELYSPKSKNCYSLEAVSINKQDGDTNYKCLIEEKSVISNNEVMEGILSRFIKQAAVYRNIFRDGQDTDNRNFDFMRVLNIDNDFQNESEIYKYKVTLDIPKDSSAKIVVEHTDTANVGKLTTDEYIYKLFEKNDIVEFEKNKEEIETNDTVENGKNKEETETNDTAEKGKNIEKIVVRIR